MVDLIGKVAQIETKSKLPREVRKHRYIEVIYHDIDSAEDIKLGGFLVEIISSNPIKIKLFVYEQKKVTHGVSQLVEAPRLKAS